MRIISVSAAIGKSIPLSINPEVEVPGNEDRMMDSYIVIVTETRRYFFPRHHFTKILTRSFSSANYLLRWKLSIPILSHAYSSLNTSKEMQLNIFLNLPPRSVAPWHYPVQVMSEVALLTFLSQVRQNLST